MTGGWMLTRWEGAKLPPFFASHFVHDARVRKLADGTIEAEWFDDESQAAKLRKHSTSAKAGGNAWRRIISPQLAQRLYDQAVSADTTRAAA